MRNKILIAASLIFCSAMVSSHSNARDVKEKEERKCNLVEKQSELSLTFIKAHDLYALNDAQVLTVPTCHVVHTSDVSPAVKGHTPTPQAMVRGPTTDRLTGKTRSRDKPV